VFGPLKTAYREQVEHLERLGANAVNKEHFVLLYRRARDVALTAHNIRSGWSKAGLFPFNPSRVLEGMSAPIEGPAAQPQVIEPRGMRQEFDTHHPLAACQTYRQGVDSETILLAAASCES